MAVRVFFEYKSLIVQLPVNPEQFIMSMAGDNSTTNIISIGEINLLKIRKLAVCELESFLPQYPDGYYVNTKGEFREPKFYIDFFNSIQEEKEPARLIITDTDINILVSVESFQYGYIAGDEDVHFKLQLKEYKQFYKLSFNMPTSISQNIAGFLSEEAIRQRPKTGFAVGDLVTANGRRYSTSDGMPPSAILPNNFQAKIGYVEPNMAYEYQLRDMNDKSYGWVTGSQLKLR